MFSLQALLSTLGSGAKAVGRGINKGVHSLHATGDVTGGAQPDGTLPSGQVRMTGLQKLADQLRRPTTISSGSTPAGDMLPIPQVNGVPEIDPLRGMEPLPTSPPKLGLPSHVGPVATEPALANPSVTERPVLRRVAKDGVGAEWRQRLEEMRSDTPQETVWRDPYGQERYDYATDGGSDDPTKRGWRQRLKNFGAGAMAGGREGGVGGALGGGLAGLIGGEIDPAGGREMQFDMWKLPRLEQQQERQAALQKLAAELAKSRQETEFRQAQTESQGQYTIDNTRYDRQGKVISRGTPKPMAVGANGLYDPEARTIIPGTQRPQAPRIDTSTRYVRQWNERTGKYEFVAGEDGKPLLSRQYEEMLKREAGQDKRAAAANQTRVTTAAMSQAGANYRHNNPTSKAEQKAEQEKTQWLAALDNAIKSSNGDPNSEAIQNALKRLQKYPDIETGIGDGGWPYAKRTASAPTGAKTFPAAQLEKYAREHSATKEEAMRYLQGQGTTIRQKGGHDDTTDQDTELHRPGAMAEPASTTTEEKTA